MQDALYMPILKGHVSIEVRDAATKELVQEIHGDNGVTNWGAEWLRLKMVSAIMHGNGMIPAISMGLSGEVCTSNLDYLMDIIKSIALTDDATPFSADDALFRGTCTAFSVRAITPAVGGLYGSLNAIESTCNENSMKLVFDFPTDRGNGTHRSVHLLPVTSLSETLFPMNAIDRVGRILIKPTLSASNLWVAMDDSNVYTVYGTPTNKLTTFSRTTGLQIAEISISGVSLNTINQWNRCATVYAGNIWLGETGTGKLTKINLSTGVVSSVTYPTGYSNGMPFVRKANFLYYLPNATTLARFNLDTGLYDTAKTLSISVGRIGLIDGGYLYLSSNADSYKYDWATNAFTLITGLGSTVSFRNPWDVGDASNPGSYLSDGVDIHLAKFTNDYVWGTAGTAYGYTNGIKIAKLDFRKALNRTLTKKVLDVPIVKTPAQTMKVVYTLTFT